MTKVIFNSESSICAEGVHTTKGCKRVVCITDRRIFTSVLDTAQAYKASAGDISRCCNEKRKRITVKGKRFCFLSDIATHLEEIFESDRKNIEKANAWDAMIAEEIAARETEEARQKEMSLTESLITKLEDKMSQLRTEQNNNAKLLYEAKNKLTMLKAEALA